MIFASANEAKRRLVHHCLYNCIKTRWRDLSSPSHRSWIRRRLDYSKVNGREDD
jgi:hypothetical protein